MTNYAGYSVSFAVISLVMFVAGKSAFGFAFGAVALVCLLQARRDEGNEQAR